MNKLQAAAYGLLGLATSAIAQGAMAQDRAAAARPDDSGDIIVTAQRREQSLQDVPVTVNVLDSRTLDTYSVANVRDAVTRIPGLEIRNSAEQDSITLRGLGNFGSTNFGFDSPIGIFIDGVYHGRINQTRLAFMDIDRLEVLKGPQSTLFGMNTPIGAISFISKKPTDNLTGYIIGTGDFRYNNYDVRGAVNVPLSDTLAIRIAALKTFEDGYYYNTTTNRHEGGSDVFGWRATAKWTPTDRLTVLAKLQGGSVDRTGPALFAVSPPTNPADLARALAIDPRASFRADDLLISQLPAQQKNRSFEPVLTVDYRLDPFTIESITAYSKYHGTFVNPLTGSPVNYGTTLGNEQFDQFSQELRLTSNGTNFFDYQAGLFYQHSKVYNQRPLDFILGNYIPSFAGTPSGALQTYIGNFRQRYNTYAAFAQGTINFSSKFKVTGGLRLTHERKVASSIFDWIVPGSRNEADVLTPGTPAFAAADFVFHSVFGINRHTASGKYSKTFLIPDVKVQWYPVSAVMLYASVGQGRQAGGFNDRDNKGFNFGFGPEKATNYEVGAKLNVFDRRLQLNVSAFHTDFQDLQVSIFDLTTNDFIVGNAARALSEGIDADFRLRVGGGFSIDGGFTWLNRNRYGKFIAPCSATAANVATCIATVRPGPGIQDRSGEQLGNAKFTSTAGAQYEGKLSSAVGITARVDLRHMSGKPISAINPAGAITPATFIDGRIGVTYRDAVSIALVGQNLTDKRHVEQTNTFLIPGLIIGTVSPPRTVSLQLGYKF